MSTWRCSTIAVFGLSPLTPLSQMIPTSVPAMPNRARVLLMLLGPVSQPTQLVGWVATAASGATVNAVAIGVDAEASATVCSDSRRDPQPSRPITRAPMPVGAFGEAAAVGLKPNAPSTLVTSFCTPAATAFTAAPSDGLAFGLSCMGVATCSVATVETTVSVLVPVCTTGSTVSIATTVLAVPPVAPSVTRREVSGSAVEVAWAWTELFFFGLVEAVCPSAAGAGPSSAGSGAACSTVAFLAGVSAGAGSTGVSAGVCSAGVSTGLASAAGSVGVWFTAASDGAVSAGASAGFVSDEVSASVLSGWAALAVLSDWAVLADVESLAPSPAASALSALSALTPLSTCRLLGRSTPPGAGVFFIDPGFRDFVAVCSDADVVAEELADDDSAEDDALLDESEPSGSAHATPVAAAAPTPNATAESAYPTDQ